MLGLLVYRGFVYEFFLVFLPVGQVIHRTQGRKELYKQLPLNQTQSKGRHRHFVVTNHVGLSQYVITYIIT